MLAARAQVGDRESMNRLLAALQAPLYAHIFAIVGNRENAEDVLQDTLFTIVRKLGTLTDPRWIRAWSYRIANRRAVRRSVSARSAESMQSEVEIDSLALSDDEPRWSTDEKERVRASLVSLSPGSAIVIQMHYLEEMTLVEIGEALELPTGTVKSRLAYGLLALRTHLS